MAHFAQYVQELGYKSCDADSDLWLKPEFRPGDKLEYYSYILCYVDDILCIHHDPDDVLNKLNGYVLLKPSSVGSPNIYLGTKLKCMQLHNDIWALLMSIYMYVQETVRICEEYVAKHLTKGYKLPRRAVNPFKCGHCLELDVFLVLRPLKHRITSP